MAVATSAGDTTQHLDVPSDEPDLLRRLQREMLSVVASARTKLDLLDSLAEILDRNVETVAMFYFQRNEQGELGDGIPLRPREGNTHGQLLSKQLMSACQAACRKGELSVRRQTAPACTILAAPIAHRGRDPEALCVIFSSDHTTSHLLMLMQMVASHIVLWHVMAGSRIHASDARDSAALVELLDQVIAATDVRKACYALAGELGTYLQFQRVAVGLRSEGKGRCRLVAVSGVAQFDKRSPTSHALEAAMDEAVLRQDVTMWPAVDDQQRPAALAHEALCSLERMETAISTPLRDEDDNAVGALVVLGDTASKRAEAERFLRAAERSLAASLVAAQRLEGGRTTRLARAISNTWRTWKGRCALAAVVLVLAAMMIPVPYNVNVDCQIEPVTRRFVAAPFEGTLEQALVKPGDIVHKGDVLARMDGREVRWKRASVVAEKNQAIKRRDSAQASHNYAEQQIAQLEIRRMDLELQLLDHRAENLEIKSPVDGIVVSGDLERAQGAPLSIGQTLFEIAPLESMIVEMSVPDDEISYIAVGQTIDVRLDAFPGQTWETVAARVQPRSEIRGEANVFIAEAELNNADGRLQPGMKGRAKLKTGKRPLGWILFHKPWEYVTKKLRW
ncbi:MAG: efflux RND transporter periplasmic adaptor subunit [Planctomycetes bacterium]|nr:efflux RND transporter periplasmic adaptor subunit [Planctomycetota bacterium]